MATCWSLFQGLGCTQLGLRRGTHLHCSWEEMFIQDCSPGVNSVSQSHRHLEQAAVGQSHDFRDLELDTCSSTPGMGGKEQRSSSRIFMCC